MNSIFNVLGTKAKYLILNIVEYLIQCTKNLRKCQRMRTFNVSSIVLLLTFTTHDMVFICYRIPI